MAETLLALLLVTTSAKGSSLVFRWPEFPSPSPRLRRARPDNTLSMPPFDNPWRASHPQETLEKVQTPEHDYGHDPEYCWQRPNALRDRSLSYSQSHHPTSGRGSRSRDRAYSIDKATTLDEYDHVLGYQAEFLANLLCPQQSMCHQKFELVVDDLAFIGHPVCADSNQQWRFKPEKLKSGSRGRETRDSGNSASPLMENTHSLSPEIPPTEPSAATRSAWLNTFHFALVLDLPDPSSSASGNLSKYFNILYEQLAFTLAAVLYQEQVLSNFVETECDLLNNIKESCISKGMPFSKYVSMAFEASSIAPAMKILYEAVKSSSMAYITINYLPLELQLPPYLDSLLHSQDDQDTDIIDPGDDDDNLFLGQGMGFGWKLPAIAPWKSLLLLDADNDMDTSMMLHGPHANPEDRALAEGVIRFLETVSITLSLSDMASLLDWDLEAQVYPIVRWLVLHRRAKVVDTVHSCLKTVFTLSPNFQAPLSQLARQFQEAFSHPSIPPLPKILATISTSTSKQTDNHFFASVVKSKDYLPIYHDVLLWMLKRDLLITLHLRIRVVATLDLKVRVKEERERKTLRKFGRRRPKRPRPIKGSNFEFEDPDEEYLSNGPGHLSFFLSPHAAHRFSRRIGSNDSRRSEISELNFGDDELGLVAESDSNSSSEPDEEDSGWDTTEEHLCPSMINDPGKATPMQRRWLSAMSEGKEPAIARRFELINQYFDGKRSDDEILYCAEISRKQLREVLHHYEDYLQTFLHPS